MPLLVLQTMRWGHFWTLFYFSSIRRMLILVSWSEGRRSDNLEEEPYEGFEPLSYLLVLSEALDSRWDDHFISSELMNVMSRSRNSAMVMTGFSLMLNTSGDSGWSTTTWTILPGTTEYSLIDTRLYVDGPWVGGGPFSVGLWSHEMVEESRCKSFKVIEFWHRRVPNQVEATPLRVELKALNMMGLLAHAISIWAMYWRRWSVGSERSSYLFTTKILNLSGALMTRISSEKDWLRRVLMSS